MISMLQVYSLQEQANQFVTDEVEALDQSEESVSSK